MIRTLYRVTMSIAGVDESSEQFLETKEEAIDEVLDWRGKVGEDTGDAWDVYAHEVTVDVPDELPTELVLALLNRSVVTEVGSTLMANRCASCDGEIEDEERTNAFAEDVEPLTTTCAACLSGAEDDE